MYMFSVHMEKEEGGNGSYFLYFNDHHRKCLAESFVRVYVPMRWAAVRDGSLAARLHAACLIILVAVSVSPIYCTLDAQHRTHIAQCGTLP